MGLFSRAENMAGLDLGSSSVKAVELRRVRAGFELVGVDWSPWSRGRWAGAIEDAESVAEAIGRLFSRSRIRARKVATSVSGHSVIVKKLTLPAMSREELVEAIQWEARQVIPFDLSEVHLDHQVLAGAPGREDTQVLLVAARKERVASRLETIAGAGLSPVIVDVDGFALHNAYEANYGRGSSVTTALLHIGAGVTNLVVTRGGIPLFTRDLSAGGNQLTGLLQQQLRIDFEEAERMKKESALEASGSGAVGRTAPIGDRDPAAGDSQEPGPVRSRRRGRIHPAGVREWRMLRVGGADGAAAERARSSPEPFDPFKSIAVGRGVDKESLYRQLPAWRCGGPGSEGLP